MTGLLQFELESFDFSSQFGFRILSGRLFRFGGILGETLRTIIGLNMAGDEPGAGSQENQREKSNENRFQFGNEHGLDNSLSKGGGLRGDGAGHSRGMGRSCDGPDRGGTKGKRQGGLTDAGITHPPKRGGQGNATPGQPGAEDFPAAVEAAPEHANAPAELVGSLIPGSALNTAKEQGSPVLVGKAIQFFFQNPLRFPIRDILAGSRLRNIQQGSLPAEAADASQTQLAGSAEGNAVQPAGQGFTLPDCFRLAGQDQKGGLESVLRILAMAKHPPANAQDHGPVALHQQCERRMVLAGEISIQEMMVGNLVGSKDGHKLAHAVQKETVFSVGVGHGGPSPSS